MASERCVGKSPQTRRRPPISVTPQQAEALGTAYLEALQAGDAERIAALFAPDGVVISPLYGQMPALEFYATLGAVTEGSETTLKRVLLGASDASIAFHFDYRWTLAGGAVVNFEVVDIVEMAPGSDRFATLTILYDTAPLRAAHAAAKAKPR